MTTEILLIVLGVLTVAIGIWNLIAGATVWGALFLAGGIWAAGLGIYYIRQRKKGAVPADDKTEQEKPSETAPEKPAESAQAPAVSHDTKHSAEGTEKAAAPQAAPEDEDNEDAAFERAIRFTNSAVPGEKRDNAAMLSRLWDDDEDEEETGAPESDDIVEGVMQERARETDDFAAITQPVETASENTPQQIPAAPEQTHADEPESAGTDELDEKQFTEENGVLVAEEADVNAVETLDPDTAPVEEAVEPEILTDSVLFEELIVQAFTAPEEETEAPEPAVVEAEMEENITEVHTASAEFVDEDEKA